MRPSTEFVEPIVENGNLVQNDVYAISLQNAGNTKVTIENRWDIYPCGSLGTGNDWLQPNSENINWKVKFDASNLDVNTPAVNKLQIMVRRVYQSNC